MARFEPQSPHGRRAGAWLSCLVWALLLILSLLRTRPFHTADYVGVAAFGLVFLQACWELASMDRSGMTGLERFWQRRIAGREIGDWWNLILGSAGAIGFGLVLDGPWAWLVASGFALIALFGAWRLVRMAPQSTLPPLTRATWPGAVESPD